MESAKTAAIEQLTEATTLSRDAVLSQAWSYPILGITYLVSHPNLYSAVAPVVVKALTTSLAITGAMFFFTFIPQLAICALFSGPLAFIPAITLVLGESYVLITFVSKAFFLNTAQDKIFDAVLLQQGNQSLVEKGRQVKSNSAGFKVLGKSLMKPLDRFSKDGVIRYIISLPLNSIPGVGTVLFLLYNGVKSGPGFHARYFQLKNFDKSTRDSFVQSRRGAYTAFGATALALNLVPVVGLLFTLTSTIGAALWASKIEKTQGTSYGAGRKVGTPGETVDQIPARDQIQVDLGQEHD
ncbi:hypothetical protein CPB83DRAFT_891137 [Crepidotus variabilis]|uniref:Outer spore wall protein RRT8 n=1 Tax=Crepidotus variabilis TaxID=179855 RepID=A0A9P6ENX6_9AGAR|nr:hypothetical protein CPB83DRAFT_891137 [Crepidotus variabilis]